MTSDRAVGTPLFNGEHLSSLATCYVNLNASCDFHNNVKYEAYRQAWAHPAPTHCQGDREASVFTPVGRVPKPTPEVRVYRDRLGANMEALCAQFAQ